MQKLIVDNKKKKAPKRNILLAKEGMKRIISDILLREKQERLQSVASRIV